MRMSPPSSFALELQRYGPQGSAAPMSEVEARTYCRRLTRSHYENFSVASFLLPKPLRVPFEVVYAYCRWSDDLGDENDGSESARLESLRLFDWWEGELNHCFDFHAEPPRHPVFQALRPIARDFSLPRKPFADLLVAFRQDQIRQRYETMDELLGYCRNSADPVGRIVLYLAFGSQDANTRRRVQGPTEEQLAWSDSICTGLQLANFWQDIARDSKIGRCYIPMETASKFGVNPRRLENTPAFRNMLRELVADARSRLLAGSPLIGAVPRSVRVDIALFQRGGLAVLDAIEKCGYNVLKRRPVVSKGTKVRLLLKTWFAGFFDRPTPGG